MSFILFRYSITVKPIDIKIKRYILIKKPVTPANEGRVILAMCIVYMDPFFITNLNHETS